MTYAVIKLGSPMKSDEVVDWIENTPKGRILRAAAHLFKKQGYEKTTVRDIAKAVGIHSGSIFHHFKSKDEILEAIMEAVILFNTHRLQQSIDTAKNLKDKMLALIKSELLFTSDETGEAMSLLITEWRSLSKLGQKRILRLRDIYEIIWLHIFNDAAKEKLISQEPFILRRFVTGIILWTPLWFKPEGKLSYDALAKSILTLLLKDKV